MKTVLIFGLNIPKNKIIKDICKRYFGLLRKVSNEQEKEYKQH